MIDETLYSILCDQTVYLCTALRAETYDKTVGNQIRAKRYAADVMEFYECKTVAPQACLPDLLDLEDPVQYRLSMQFRDRLMDFCDILLVCGNVVTQEMEQELMLAVAKGLLVVSQAENAVAVHTFLQKRGLWPEVVL